MAKRITIMLICGAMIAACGSSGSPTKNAAKGYSQALQFSKCMRAHGVSNFPDPSAGGGGIHLSITPGSGINPQSPAFQSVQASCKHLLPGGGPGSGPPNPQAKAHLLQVSECMRSHGITEFPDPHSGSPPPNGGYSGAVTAGGYYLAIPSSINVNSPAFEQAAAACKFGPRGAPVPKR
jgi:hypothetical protein